MDRYRNYAPLDDQPIQDGDNNFFGVNLYDSAETLPPGLVQAATNVDFTSADAVTRGGLVCIPELGNAPFGQTWVNTTPAAANNWKSVAFGNGLFVAVSITGAGNRVMTSPDGITWTTRASAADNNWSDICWGNNLFVAVSSTGGVNSVMTSPNGVAWTLRTTPSSGWQGVTYGNALYVAVGGTAVMTSPDGITWTARTGAVPSGLLRSVSYGNAVYVAVSALGDCMTSPDGITWTLTTPTAPVLAGMTDIVFGGGIFVAMGGAGNIYTTPDGVDWTTRTAPNANTWFSIAYGSNGFIAVASTGATGQVMTSTNGIAWFTREASQAAAWSGVAMGGTVGVVVGNLVSMVTGAGVQTVFATGHYSDPNATTDPWIVLAGATSAGFYAFGQTSRSVAYPSGYTITEQSCIVQANNLLFIFSGPDQSPIQWDGSWGGIFAVCPVATLGAAYESIPFSNQATYYQNRLWVMQGKDTIAGSELLDFKNFKIFSNVFNLNVGTSDYVVSSYPFGSNSLVVFKNHSSYLLQNVDGALTDVTSTEITRQIGIIGINACCAVGPDLVYMSSERNITTIKLNIQNATQAVTVPLSRNINPIMDRVNWTYGYKVSMGYNNNLLYISLPLDNATVCNTILVYNFITNQWYGEWNFAPEISMCVQDFIDSNYLGRIRMHVVTEDGRIFIVDEGQNDISGTIVSEINLSLTTRAYVSDNNSKINRRMYADLDTNRPNFSVEAFSEGASESSEILTDQTYSRADSWLFNDSTYAMNNSNDDYNRAYRKDYSSGPDSIQPGSGYQPEMTQNYRLPLITRRKGRLAWFKITNTTGFISINGIGVESRVGDRSSLTQVG